MTHLDIIIVKPEDAVGDTIISTRLLKSLSKTFPQTQIFAAVSGFKVDLLEGILIENGGFVSGRGISRIVERDYNPSSNEFLIDISSYINANASLTGENYSESMFRLAEEQLKEKGIETRLNREVSPELRFDNVPAFKEHVEKGRNKVGSIKKEYGDKQILWLGTRTSGSKNRMPQSYKPYENFWSDLIDEIGNDFVLYEIRGPGEKPIDERVEPKAGENYRFAATSEIIKNSVAGIGLDGMQIELAYALGKRKMVVLIGPTHPKANIYPGSEGDMITVPDISRFEKGIYCRGCGNVGYSTSESFNERKSVMQERYPTFEFDKGTQKALETNSQEDWKQIIGCRKIKSGEDYYDCWKQVSVEEIASKLKILL